jgi:hypothetical protein
MLSTKTNNNTISFIPTGSWASSSTPLVCTTNSSGYANIKFTNSNCDGDGTIYLDNIKLNVTNIRRNIAGILLLLFLQY